MHLQRASRRESGVEKCWLSFWFSNQTVELWDKYLLVFVFEVFAFWMIINFTHSGGTETKVKEIVSDIPPHTNQNIGIF